MTTTEATSLYLSRRNRGRAPLVSGIVTAMKMTTVAATAGVLLVVGVGATVAAQADAHHTTQTSHGCKLVSRTQTQPAYSSLYDTTGPYTVTTVEKCQGRTVTHTVSYVATRTVKVPCGVHSPYAAYRAC